jgi:hypothetical protein
MFLNSKLTEGLHRLRSHGGRNWLTYASLLLIAFVTLGVPQVRNLFAFPPLSGGATSAATATFYVYAAVLIGVYVVTGGWIVPPRNPLKTPAQPPPPAAANAAATTRNSRLWAVVERRRWAVAVIGYVLGGALIAFALAGGPDLAEIIEPSILLSFGALFLAFAALMTAWNYFDDRTRRLLVRVMTALLALNLVGEAVWWLGEHQTPFSFRYYSLWAILHTLFCLLLFARVVDYWQAYSPWPIRTLAILLVLAMAAAFGPRSVGTLRPAADFYGSGGVPLAADEDAKQRRPQMLPGIDLAVADSWLAHLKMRLDAIPDDGPVVLVAASGGGSRAALFTALVYEDLRRKAVKQDGFPDYRIDQHILLISSVSGGSLASACYVDENYNRTANDRAANHEPNNFFADETLTLMEEALPSIRGRPWYEGTRSNGDWVAWWQVAEKDCLVEEGYPWYFDPPFVDDMCTDFMAPLLRGTLHPLEDRGESTMRFWQRRFGLSGTNLDWHRGVNDRLAAAARNRAAKSDAPKLEDWPPLLLCNVSEVERGNRTIIGFPPLPYDLLTFDIDAPYHPREWIALDASEEQTRQVSEVSLAEAVRLSAGFPWGFPVARVDIPQRTVGGSTRPDVRFLDGGVADNTGIDSLHYVVDRLQAWARLAEKKEVSAAHRRRYTVAQEVVDELIHRGIVILEIDSGAKPQAPGAIARYLSGLLEPVAALENAGYAHAASDTGSHIDEIESLLPFRRARQLRWRIERLMSPKWRGAGASRQGQLPNVERITVVCNHDENVMTAWALGPRDKARVFLRFAAGSAKMHDQWEDYLARYHRQRQEVDEIDARLKDLEEMQPAGQVSQVALSEVAARFRKLVGDSHAEQSLRKLDAAVEARFAQGRPPSNAYLAQMEALIESEQRQIDVDPQADVLRPPPAARNGAGKPEKQARDVARPAPPPSAQQKQLQKDFSRVGESMKKIQEKVRAINK